MRPVRLRKGASYARFFKRTGQTLIQTWLIEIVKRLMWHVPAKLLITMGLANVLRPRTRGWGRARDAINEYVSEQNATQRQALGLDNLINQAKSELDSPAEKINA